MYALVHAKQCRRPLHRVLAFSSLLVYIQDTFNKTSFKGLQLSRKYWPITMTYEQLIHVHPYQNMRCVVYKCTGQPPCIWPDLKRLLKPYTEELDEGLGRSNKQTPYLRGHDIISCRELLYFIRQRSPMSSRLPLCHWPSTRRLLVAVNCTIMYRHAVCFVVGTVLQSPKRRLLFVVHWIELLFGELHRLVLDHIGYLILGVLLQASRREKTWKNRDLHNRKAV